LSPKKHVEKVYVAKVDRELVEKDIKAFALGITLDDGYKTLPAVLEPMGELQARVIIKEGKFHQVKRMFEAIGASVTSLKRVTFAGIELDNDLTEGEFRRLNENEMNIISNLLSKD